MSRLEQLAKLAALTPDDPLAHYGLGLEYVNLERWDEAQRAFDGAIAADARYSAAYYHKARAQIAAGRPEDARATLAAGMRVAGDAGDWHTLSEMRELLGSIE